MKKLIATAFLVGIGLAGMPSVHAMPGAPLGDAPGAMAIPASGGCGILGHRGPDGLCHALFSCPTGWHSSPSGRRCFRNRPKT